VPWAGWPGTLRRPRRSVSTTNRQRAWSACSASKSSSPQCLNASWSSIGAAGFRASEYGNRCGSARSGSCRSYTMSLRPVRTAGHPCGATLPHSETPVQPQPKLHPCVPTHACAALRRAASHSGGLKKPRILSSEWEWSSQNETNWQPSRQRTLRQSAVKHGGGLSDFPCVSLACFVLLKRVRRKYPDVCSMETGARELSDI